LAPVLLGVAQLELSSMGDRAKVIEAVLIPVLFFMAMTNRTLGRVLSFKPLVLIGLSSYSLYLLHANVGVTLIRYFSTIFSLGTAGSVALAFAIASALVAFNYGLFQLYERRTNRYIVGVLLGKRNGGQPKANAS
jgi:peptidoglycan/LPS O-acetylase OafA/YrhL